MAADQDPAAEAATVAPAGSGYLQKFRLYETRSKFYMVGSNKSRTLWKVLKIDRLEPSELSIREDPTTYSESECFELLKRVHEGNISTGGLKFVTKCYGIAGFVKFLGPYYMLLITRRRKIGTICGHTIYTVSKSEMVPLPNSAVQSNFAYSKDENRYKRLLCNVDLTKDFFFSYSYNIMRSLQMNLCNNETGIILYETMFVWNEFLTRGVRNHLKNTTWTVALVYGYFKQVKLSICGKDFWLTLIARRSRHCAGTRFLKRGVNEKGRVANDVELEQIVFEDISKGVPAEITSIVQNRGSIPLFWSQETSKLNIRPDIILHKKDRNFEATRLHFGNLVKRYGNPIIILNLIKSREKKPRESLLRAEFANAIDFINKDLPEEKRLKFLHWDIQKHTRRKGSNVLELLGKVAAYALDITGFFYCQITPALKIEDGPKSPEQLRHYSGELLCNSPDSSEVTVSSYDSSWKDEVHNSDVTGSEFSGDKTKQNEDSLADEVQNSASSQNKNSADKTRYKGDNFAKILKFQKGVLRTNCIDCLDRTNVAQYAYGLAALGYQLHALGFMDLLKVDLDSPLADDLMALYERMGDTLALQYGGSAAHNKIFSERRGQWKAATQSQELFRTIQRYYSNAYMDAEKQDSINLFLGHFQPQQGKPAIWELDTKQQRMIGQHHTFADENKRSSFFRSFIIRSLSDGNIPCESHTPVPSSDTGPKSLVSSALPPRMQQESDVKGLCDSTPEISTCENDISYSRYTPTISKRQLFSDGGHVCFSEHRFNDSNCSNFLDFDWLSSSGNSCEDEGYERSSLINSPTGNLSTENIIDEEINILSDEGPNIEEVEPKQGEPAIDAAQSSNLGEFSDGFAHWVAYGGTLCY
ncbi:phosphoinositide phosphatase SAC2-like isoform X2 [Musa acuminata AAA Group]|uniref:phosphoinositide phosphatase SAC2-like isoform X2 n=1 Tax=Musa acuminata AAA Group TaxID=214697 RepID=UPI0031E114F3